MDDLLSAERQRADLAATATTSAELDALWEGPETTAVEAAEAQGVLLCLAAQAEFDATEERDQLEDVPWIPPDMKEVISVALGCPEQ